MLEGSVREWLFTGFGLFVLGCAVAVVFARNPIYSAFSLILCFFGLSGLYVLWNAPFIAMIQILIYTGAIVVLFVFVVMLLNLGRGSGSAAAGWLTVLISGGAVWCFSLLLLRALNRTPFYPPGSNASAATDMRTISKLLFTDYLWPFEVLSVFLLALILAIYALARPATQSEETA